MRILHYCAHGGGFTYEWQHHHMIHELRTAGHDVIVVNPVDTLGHEAEADTYAEIAVEQAKRHAQQGVDLFFAMATDDMITAEAVTEIRRHGIPTVNLSCEDYAEPWRVRRTAGSYDILWTTVPENTYVLKSYGARVLHMPFGANPHVFRPVKTEEAAAVGFIGTLYGARARKLSLLVKAGIPSIVHGRPPWEQYGGQNVKAPLVRAFRDLGHSFKRFSQGLRFASGRQCVCGALKRSLLEMFGTPVEKEGYLDKVSYRPSPAFDEIGKCISSAAIDLGDTELRSTYVMKRPLLFLRLRDFEAPMCGGVHLVNRKPELQEYFTEDEEMLMYDSDDEMIDKARFYLAPERDSRRNSIRRCARARAVSEHTWCHRFSRLGKELGITFPPVPTVT